MHVNLIDHLPVQDRLTRLRRSGIRGSEFRALMEEIGMFMAYEFAKTLNKKIIKVKTPLGVSDGSIIKNESDIVVVNVLRAAIPLVNGITKIFNESQCGMIGACREESKPFKIHINYTRIPNINGKIVLIADPMLATANTMKEILNKITTLGTPARIVLFHVVASKEGIKNLTESIHDIEIYTCAIDDKVNNDGYIVPGLGDAGDICFGKPI